MNISGIVLYLNLVRLTTVLCVFDLAKKAVGSIKCIFHYYWDVVSCSRASVIAPLKEEK